MASFDVLNREGTKVGDIDLADEVFGAPIRQSLLWEIVKAQQASKRSGTASTKPRTDVSGGGAKPWRQKGTGRARAGSSRSYIWVGGGSYKGPRPRDYSYSPNKKMRKGALRSAVSMRAKEQKLIVLDNFDLSEAKTRHIAEMLGNLGAGKALFVDAARNESFSRSARNLASSQFLPCEGLNVYDILKHEFLIVSQEGARAIERRLQS